MTTLLRMNALTDEGLAHFQEPYSSIKLRKEDVFYYIYGLLHSPDYRKKYSANLEKQLPRIPRVASEEDFLSFRDSGVALARLHLFYEELPLFQGVQLECPTPLVISAKGITGGNDELFHVEKMKFGLSEKQDGERRAKDKTVIVYNPHITVRDVPLGVYEYQVNGKSPPEWAMDRQRISIDKNSGIQNDANDWAKETCGNPRYPLELLFRLMTVSLETQKLIEALPSIDFATAS